MAKGDAGAVSGPPDRAQPPAGRAAPRRIAVVVATLNEADRLADALGLVAFAAPEVDLVVADGGSTDGTPALARRLGARVLAAPPGRGRQLHAGAAGARGEALLFLHADTRLADGALDAVRRALTDPAVVGGNFALRFDGASGFDRWLEGFYAFIRRRGLYYGDSAIFVRRDVYDALGGIRPIALMEDYDFVRRLERAGATANIAAPPAVTSSRRFQGRRPWRIVAQWLLLHALFHLGVPPDRLARLYRSGEH